VCPYNLKAFFAAKRPTGISLMQLNASIFKAHLLSPRIVPSTINEDCGAQLTGVWHAGRKETTVAVGRDGRLSGPSLAQALMRGLVASGVNVIDVGMVTTPCWAMPIRCARPAFQLTAATTRDYNGFKMVMGGRDLWR
jgi:phosphomannomutase